MELRAWAISAPGISGGLQGRPAVLRDMFVQVPHVLLVSFVRMPSAWHTTPRALGMLVSSDNKGAGWAVLSPCTLSSITKS